MGRNSGRYRLLERVITLQVDNLKKAHAVSQHIEKDIRGEVPYLERVLSHYDLAVHTHPHYAFPLTGLNGKPREQLGDAPYFTLVTSRLSDGGVDKQEVWWMQGQETHHIFGPVPSRRLGKSLGIDPVPLKTCNWNCVYCQLGRTRPMTNVQREYIPCDDILSELKVVLASHKPGEIDWVTFVGSGEPTLHSGLGRMIRQVKKMTDLPVAIITNGALLYLPELRAGLAAADAVLPSLDAGNPRLYRKVNRPWSKLTYDRLLAGLIAFRREYTGQLWVEVMLVHAINDTEEALQELATAFEKIQPDQVHLLLPVRPPAESWVQPSDTSRVQRALDIIGTVAPVILPDSLPEKPIESGENMGQLDLAILSIIQRHPMQEDELCSVLNKWSPEAVHQSLHMLLSAGKIQTIKRFNRFFWSLIDSYYQLE